MDLFLHAFIKVNFAQGNTGLVCLDKPVMYALQQLFKQAIVLRKL